MRRIYISFLMLLSIIQLGFANPDSVKFAIIRLDYLTYSLKHIYYFQQPYQSLPPPEYGKTCGKLHVIIEGAMDFGGTTILNLETGQVVYEATTVWAGSGEHIFPTPEFQIFPGYTGFENASPVYFDIVDRFFHGNDSARTDTVWNIAQQVAPLSLFSNKKFGALIYLHYFSVGIGNPATAEWIVILYTLSEAASYRWDDISGDLPNRHINSIAPHPFYTDSLYVGTDAGAFETNDHGKHWRLIKFDEKPEVKVTQIIAEVHPILDWTVPVLWLGTEEYTIIPEDRLGRIFFSANGGMEWNNTYFPKIVVSALDVPYDSSLVAFAGAYNPFYNQDGLFTSDDTGWVKYDLTPGDTSAIRIIDIDVDETNPQRIFLATSNGVFATINGGKDWTQTDPYHPATAIVISPFSSKGVYAIQLFGTRSEGIYRSKDDGQTWERRCWTVSASNLIADARNPGTWYWSVKNIGVFKSIDDCSTHIEISEGLKEKDILCLAQDRRNPKILYAGTTHGIFRYEEVPTNIWQDDKAPQQFVPQNFKLYPAYPNPFNSSTVIRFELKKEQHIRLAVYNLLGQEIRSLDEGMKSAGNHQTIWDGKDNHGFALPSGLYFCRLTTGKDEQARKMLLLQPFYWLVVNER
ncbi:MAG: T9SS type A sorting domain-containing protein [bacterium]|nr:T9SS type A sorting domain-containing protein [bacterium]